MSFWEDLTKWQSRMLESLPVALNGPSFPTMQYGEPMTQTLSIARFPRVSCGLFMGGFPSRRLSVGDSHALGCCELERTLDAGSRVFLVMTVICRRMTRTSLTSNSKHAIFVSLLQAAVTSGKILDLAADKTSRQPAAC